MSSAKKPNAGASDNPPAGSAVQPAAEAGSPMAWREISSREKPDRCNFPGPRGAQSPLRIAVNRTAYAEVIAHAKSSLDTEVCGVLAGRVCEDDEGLFVHVQAAICGTAASQGSTHVTFTHATWNAIHTTLERDYPKLKIVGWYHSHPGFGVEFSEMDLFIQRNFFSSPTQIALVTDPLRGTTAICVNTPQGIEYLPRFWVDGREQECRQPAAAGREPGGSLPAADESLGKLQELERRLSQLVVAVDDLRSSLHRFLLLAGGLVCLGILVVAGYTVFLQLQSRLEPPRNIGFAPVPVKVGDHTALLGVEIVSWQLPPELNVVQQIVDELKRKIEDGAATNAPSATSNAPPARRR